MGLKNYRLFSLFIAMSCSGALTLPGCNGAESVPISLPVPFSGSLTSDTNVLIAEGNPLGVSAPLKFSANIKSQSNSQFPLSWRLFDSSSGVANGTVTFNSMTDPQLSSLSSGGIKRVYELDACATIGSTREACASRFQCFEYPTDYIPSSDLINFAASIPGTAAKVKKVVCSGNIDRTQGPVTPGELLDGKFVIGSACTPNDETCVFHSQLESAVAIHGTSFTSLEGNPDGKVVFTMITQGGALPHPVPQDPLGVNFPLLLPGDATPAGDFFGITLSGQTFPPGLPFDQAEVAETIVDAEFLLGSSRLVVHNVRILTNRVPELDVPVREALRTEFAGEPGVTPRLLEEGVYIYNSVEEKQSDVINCDPNAGEATGVFQDLCVQFGPIRATFLCTTLAVLSEPFVIDSFMFTGVWSIVKD